MKVVKAEKLTSPKTKGGLWVLIVAAVVLEAMACIQYFYTRSTLHEEAERRAKTELKRAELEIEKHTIEMETAAKMLAMLAEKNVNCPDSMFAATRSVVGVIKNNNSVAVAFVPGYFSEYGQFFEACSSHISGDSIYTRQIGNAGHDYTQLDWYKNGFIYDGCHWSEPYLDDSGSHTYVVSCSCPVHDKNGVTVAVVCVDLSLAYLQKFSSDLQIQLYKDSYCSIRSAKGEDIVAKPDTIAGRGYEVFDEQIEATGWKMSIIIPKDIIYGELRRVAAVVSVLMLLGLVLLVFIMIRASRSLINEVTLSSQQERMESELSIARNIQMTMLPTRFPPFPDYPNLNAFGEVLPAKEVGGDLFDFCILDGHMYFCVGDVSGKGVPASLVMAVTRSLFRSFTSYIHNPGQIVSQMNESLSGERNDQNMFVTMFVGALDLGTGELTYCNAGHDAPVLLQSDNSPFALLPCEANLPLGVLSGFKYVQQSVTLHVGDTLFLYTDGLTEAENVAHEQFGRERMMRQLQQSIASNRRSDISCAELVRAMQASVGAFVGDAKQSDDLTLFAIRLLALSPKDGLSSLSEHGERSSLVMRNDIQQIPTLAEWIDSLHIPAELSMPINLALEEAVSNVMLYAYPGSAGRVLVEAEQSADRIVFTISDSGIPFDPTQQKEADITLSVEERAIGGLGIHLVRQIMDEVHYERKDNKNILTLTKRI